MSAARWVSVTDAADLVHRSQRTLYAWVKAGRISARRDDKGALSVNALEVMEAERTVVRGRPVGTARPSRRHTDGSGLQ